jgi:hypothetical protein
MSTPVKTLIQHLNGRRSGKGWIAKCPAHNDREPSLSIPEGNDGESVPEVPRRMRHGRCALRVGDGVARFISYCLSSAKRERRGSFEANTTA